MLKICMIKYYLERYKTLEICLSVTIKILPLLLVFIKLLKKLDDVILSNYDIVFVNEDSNNVTFLVTIWYTLIILSLMMIVLMMMILKLLLMLNFWLCVTDINSAYNAYKKEIRKDLIIVAWHTTRWCDWCMPVDEKVFDFDFDIK